MSYRLVVELKKTVDNVRGVVNQHSKSLKEFASVINDMHKRLSELDGKKFKGDIIEAEYRVVDEDIK